MKCHPRIISKSRYLQGKQVRLNLPQFFCNQQFLRQPTLTQSFYLNAFLSYLTKNTDMLRNTGILVFFISVACRIYLLSQGTIFLQLTRLHLKKTWHSRLSVFSLSVPRPGSEVEIKSPRLCRFEPERAAGTHCGGGPFCEREMRPARYGSRGASFFFNCRCMISWLDCEAPGKVICKSAALTETSFSALKIPLSLAAHYCC